MNNIKQITVITQQGIGITRVGSNNIYKIIDNSREYENGIDFIYDCFDKNNYLIKSIINCPVEIDYFL
jgi:hypothetical protein